MTLYYPSGKRIPHRYQAAYRTHKWDAEVARGIEFHFTLLEWIQWWETNLGEDWFQMRGRLSHQYCMARKGDKGPYASWNVECITVAENHRATKGTSRSALRTR